MINYTQAAKQIKEIKIKIKNLSFLKAYQVFNGFNYDGNLFDFDFKDITGTITNKNNLATINKSCCFDIYDSKYLENGLVFHGTEKEINQKANEEKQKARNLAVSWQSQLDSSVQHSWQWCIEWQARFEKIGRKYGLLKEFKENMII